MYILMARLYLLFVRYSGLSRRTLHYSIVIIMTSGQAVSVNIQVA